MQACNSSLLVSVREKCDNTVIVMMLDTSEQQHDSTFIGCGTFSAIIKLRNLCNGIVNQGCVESEMKYCRLVCTANSKERLCVTYFYEACECI